MIWKNIKVIIILLQSFDSLHTSNIVKFHLSLASIRHHGCFLRTRQPSASVSSRQPAEPSAPRGSQPRLAYISTRSGI